MHINAALALLLLAPAAHAGPLKKTPQILPRAKIAAQDDLKPTGTPRPIFQTLTGTTLPIPTIVVSSESDSAAQTSRQGRPTSLEVIPIEDTTTSSQASSTGSEELIFTSIVPARPGQPSASPQPATSDSSDSKSSTSAPGNTAVPALPPAPETTITTSIGPVAPSSKQGQSPPVTPSSASTRSRITPGASKSGEEGVLTTSTGPAKPSSGVTENTPVPGSSSRVGVPADDVTITTSIIPGRSTSADADKGSSTPVADLTPSPSSADARPSGAPGKPTPIDSSTDVIITTSITPAKPSQAKPPADTPSSKPSSPVAEPQDSNKPAEPTVRTSIVPARPSSDVAKTTSLAPPAGSPVSSTPVRPTNAPDSDVPTVNPDPVPTGTSTVPQQVYATNLARARDLNKVFANLTPESACSVNQGACVNGQVARCKDGAFALTACNTRAEKCFALPLNNADGVVVKCMNTRAAKAILEGDGNGGAQPAPTSTPQQPPAPVVTMTTIVTVSDLPPAAPSSNEPVLTTSIVPNPQQPPQPSPAPEEPTTTTKKPSRPSSLVVIPIDDEPPVPTLPPMPIFPTLPAPNQDQAKAAASTVVVVLNGTPTVSLFYTETVTETERETVTLII